jgi:alkaline phosphatase D
LILTSVVIYLACLFGWSEAFGSHKPTLHEAFPKLFPHPQHDTKAENTTSAQHDHQEPVLYEDEKSFLKIAFLGIPDWKNAAWSYISIAVNILFALFTLDLVFRGPALYPSRDLTFSRVGYVGSNTAKVLVRDPNPSHLPIYVYLSPADKTTWTSTDTIYYLGEDTDYTYPITFKRLQPSRKYTYSLSNELSGTFTTAPSPHSEAADSLTFLTSSCIKANFPYKVHAHALAIHGLEYLSKVVQSLPSPASFMLFLGDFIYVDVPLRLSASFQHYRSEYRRVYASPSWDLPGLSSLPWLHTLDDHEIANDWSGGNDTAPFPAASDPFIHYHVSVNPPIPPNSPTGPETNTTYFQFTDGPASFFMLDTRRYRTGPEPQPSSHRPSTSDTDLTTSKPLYGSSSTPPNPPPPSHNHTMLGHTQLTSLLRYLNSREPPHVHWKIIASSVPFTKNWRFGTSDTWGGFLSERAQILSAMHEAERTLGVRVIILSGDRHEFAAIRYPPSQDQNQIRRTSGSEMIYDHTPSAGPHEFSVGPLSMFYLPLRTFKQTDDQEVAIKYLPDGNSKVGVVDISPLAGEEQRSLLKYSLWVDGVRKWEYTLTSPAVGFVGGRGEGWRLWS